MIKIIVIILVIYFLVVSRSKLRLPSPSLQATVDILKAVDLRDDEVISMSRQYVQYADTQNRMAQPEDPYHLRLKALTSKYIAVNGVPLNFRVYHTAAINAFATADGSIRIFSGLMDILTDDELLSIVGHEMGHIRNSDTLNMMRKALLASAARGLISSAGGALGALTGSQLGSLAEKITTAQFSQKQEFSADDFSFDFLIRNGHSPRSLASSLEKIHRLSQGGNSDSRSVMQFLSTHPDIVERARRIIVRAASRQKQIDKIY